MSTKKRTSWAGWAFYISVPVVIIGWAFTYQARKQVAEMAEQSRKEREHEKYVEWSRSINKEKEGWAQEAMDKKWEDTRRRFKESIR